VARLRGLMRRLPTDFGTRDKLPSATPNTKLKNIRYEAMQSTFQWRKMGPLAYLGSSIDFDALPRSSSVWTQLRPTGEHVASSVQLVGMNQEVMNIRVLRLPLRRFSDKDGSKVSQLRESTNSTVQRPRTLSTTA
jgi:hypothetical protein